MKKHLINFTVGPVQMEEEIRRIGAEEIPYFRTPEFSEIMLENERMIKKLSDAGQTARAVFLTASGTAAMEAAVMHMFSEKDKVLVINGGTFGQRFVELCEIYEIPFEQICVPVGKNITKEMLDPFENQGYTGFLVNAHETSTGVLYDMDLIADFCKRNHLFLLVDAISSFLADPFSMKKWGVQVMIAASQKALACPPGISFLVLSEEALVRARNSRTQGMYLNLKRALEDGERGQTPFTPAVGTLLQIHRRLCEIEEIGLNTQMERVHSLAEDFREKIQGLPFHIVSESLSNALTPLQPEVQNAYEICMRLKEEYQIWVCPNGGDLKNKIFRVGHIGNLTEQDNTRLAEALKDIAGKGNV